MMRFFNPAFLLHCFAGIFMTGVIWFVQVVHYPLFAQVGVEHFVRYEEFHTWLTAFVVLPPMCMELGTAVFLFGCRAGWLSARQRWGLLSLTLTTWLLTFAIHVPKHETLSRAFDPDVHRALVSTNWIRTLVWTFKSLLIMRIIASRLPSTSSVTR